METDVQRIEARPIAQFGGDRRLAQIFLQRLPARVFQPPRRLGRDFAFDRAANEQPLAHILGRNARDERAVLRLDQDEPFERETAQRGRNWKARDPQRLA